jgi:hypothetical protein
MYKKLEDLPKSNQEILKNSNTFKSYVNSDLKSLKIESYFQVYDEIFEKFINKNITFVEIGVFNGGSLKMWKNYFGDNARIIGIDLNPKAKELEKMGFEIFIGSQSSETFWDNFYNKVGNVDIVLDDGGHQNDQQIITAAKSIPNINDGGLLVTEDVHTSYLKKFGNPSGYSFINYTKKKIDEVNYRFPEFSNQKSIEKKIFSISFFESIVVFNINSKKSQIPYFLKNNDNNLFEEDFEDKSFSEFFPKIQNFIDKKLFFMKKIPILKNLIRILFYKKNIFIKLKEYLILKKFFK